MHNLRRFFGKEWWAPLIVGIAGIALSSIIAWYVDKRSEYEAESEFMQISERLVQSLERRLDSYDHGLRGLRGLLDVAKGQVSDQAFRLYLANRNLTEEFPGALGFGFIRRVKDAQLDAYVAQRQRIRPIFRLQSFGSTSSDHFIVETIEPHESNWAVLGVDIASELHRRDTALTAMLTGEATLTPPLTMERSVRNDNGLLYLLPYYRPGAPVATALERESALEGWIYVPILIHRLLDNLSGPTDTLFNYALFSGKQAASETLLYANPGYEPSFEKTGFALFSGSITSPRFVRHVTMGIGSQTFTLQISSQKEFDSQYLQSHILLTFSVGIVITGLLCWSLWLLGRTRQRALKLAEMMSAAARDREAQINAVLNNTVESIITADQQGTIRSFNRAAQVLFGYTEEEACGRNVAFLGEKSLSDLDGMDIRRIMARSSLSSGASVVEINARDRSGRVFPAEMSVGEFTLAGETIFVGMLRDISWRKRQEEEKAAIQFRLQLALDAAGFGVWQWWPDTRYFEWDSNVCRLYGLGKDEYPRDFDSWAKLIHPDDLERVIQTMRDAFNGSSKTSEICRLRWPDGSIRYMVSHLRIVTDSKGRASAIGVSQDVTAQKLTEASLRMSEERFALAARAAQEGIWDWDLRTGQIWFSPQWKAHFGYRDDELENSFAMWEKLILPEDHDEVLNMVERFNRGETERYEAIQRFLHKDGHTVFIRSRAVQLRNEQGEVVRIVGSHEDITEILRQESDLRESRERLALTIDCAGLGIWDWNFQTNDAVYGGKWGEMLGYSLDEVRQNVVTWQTLVHPDDYPHVMEAHAMHWRGETPVYSTEYRMRTKQGTWRWVQGVGRVIARDAEGRPMRMLGVNIDIDTHKNNEAALQEARQLAEEASRAKSEFLANISHEIRTPLNAVLGFSTLLTETSLNTRQIDFVDSIHTAGDVLLTLINDLLDFSKIEAGHLELEEIEFDTRSTLEDTLDIVAARAATKGINLACLIEPSVPLRMVGDPSRLRQILLNLLINAVKFTEHGEVIARAQAQQNPDASIRLRVEVRDSGIGIPTEVQTKLFRPFTQADASTTRRFGGTGLGLSICRRLTEAMNGNIGVQSTLGSGSLFWFEVTLHAAPEYCALPLMPTDIHGKKVLVVDTSPINRELLTLQMQSIGLIADCHATPASALQTLKAESDPYLLAILCQQLPDMDGIHLAEAIHAVPAWNNLPLILLTSLATQELAAEARHARVASFLLKPVRQMQLVASIREALKLQPLPQPRVLPILNTFPQWLAEERPYLLLAEDNPVNQKVAALMLEGLGCKVDIVSNGVAALTALETRVYDLVLMDCQMPEMDGYTTTEHIRALPGIRRNVPIVALTANAFRADAERCFKAGMNDFVSKPFTREQLQQVLLRWLPAQRNANSISPPSVPGVEVEQNHAVQANLVSIQEAFDELRQNLGLDMRDELLGLYFPTQNECLEQLESALEIKDFTQAHIAAHKLKGAAAQLGAKGLAAQCLALERTCRENDAVSAQAHFSVLREQAEGLRQALLKENA